MSQNDMQRQLGSGGDVRTREQRFDWRRLAVAGGWGLLVLGLSVFVVGIDLFDRLYEITRAHEDWELDELLSLLLCIGVVSIAFLIVRTRQLSREIARREAAERLAHDAARHDPLTGVANARRFREALTQAIAGAGESRSNCAVLFIDLDHFKPVNDVHGHAVGDQVLIAVAQQIVQAAPAGATIARLGGDEFGVLVLAVAGRESVLFLAQRLSRDIAKPKRVGGAEVEVGATVGIAIFPEDGTDAAALIKAADQSMYAAKPSRRALAMSNDIQKGTLAK